MLWWDTATSSLSFQPLVDLMRYPKSLWSRQFWKILEILNISWETERDDPLCIIGLCWWCLFFHVLHSLTQRFYLLIAISHPQSRLRKRLACVVHFLWRHHIPITTNKPWETRFFEAILTFHNGQNYQKIPPFSTFEEKTARCLSFYQLLGTFWDQVLGCSKLVSPIRKTRVLRRRWE